MSKVEKLKVKYPVSPQTFNRLVKADETVTKKYLEYMLQMWTQNSNTVPSLSSLIEQVQKFHELLPYIPLKDIYHFEYKNWEFLVAMNEKAEEVKEEKYFVREEHCDVILENDSYLLIHPKTFKGSLKYGSSTKWCTASKSSPGTFERYAKDGTLAYLIDKTESKGINYNKIAFYVDYKISSLSGEILIFDAVDKNISDGDLSKNDWEDLDILEIITNFRYFALKQRRKYKAKSYLTKFSDTANKLDFEQLKANISLLTDTNEEDITGLQKLFNKLENKIKTIL